MSIWNCTIILIHPIIPWTTVITKVAFFKASKSPGNSDVLGCKEAARHRQQLCDYCTSAKHPHCPHLQSEKCRICPQQDFDLIWFDWLLTLSLETVFTKSTNNQSLEMTAPAPCKPLLVCGTGMYLGSFTHPLYGELKHLFNRCDSRANCTHSARAKVCKLRVQTHFPSQD